jgi:hypothetical protein
MGAHTLQMNKGQDYSGWFTASAKLGCGGKEAGEKTVTCMRTKDFKEILTAISVNLTNPFAMNFGPTPDEKMVFKDIKDMSDQGTFHKVVSLSIPVITFS